MINPYQLAVHYNNNCYNVHGSKSRVTSRRSGRESYSSYLAVIESCTWWGLESSEACLQVDNEDKTHQSSRTILATAVGERNSNALLLQGFMGSCPYCSHMKLARLTWSRSSTLCCIAQPFGGRGRSRCTTQLPAGSSRGRWEDSSLQHLLFRQTWRQGCHFMLVVPCLQSATIFLVTSL
jgi:hypothetical protein